MKSQEWKIVRTQAGENPLSKPPKTLILFNDEPLGFVQSYSVGQSVGNQYETLLLEILAPALTIQTVTEDELDELIGKPSSKYKDLNSPEDLKPTKEEYEYGMKLAEVLIESEKSDPGSSTP